MANDSLPRRLLIYVDGTYCTADGAHGFGYGNVTNVYRLYVSAKEGVSYDETTNKTFNQIKIYKEGLGSADRIRSLKKLAAGAWGQGYQKLIQELYEECCKLQEEDEIWFYGFSRGAYIVRAIAGLVHYLGALKAAGKSEFKAEYLKALDVCLDHEQHAKFGPGQLDRFLSLNSRKPAKIQFVGVFDTVKALSDGNLYDISFNDSTQHFRHALAFNETRKPFAPEYVFPDYSNTKTRLGERSFIQAWFIGAHLDMGGSGRKDGLSLYPLQWMMIESKSKGLVTQFTASFNPNARIDDPLHLLFPQESLEETTSNGWHCATKNGIIVKMQDLSDVHKSLRYKSRYNIRLNNNDSWMFTNQPRMPFNSDGSLRGYCAFGPQGTIIHPSVYQLLDEYRVISLMKKEMPFQHNINNWRSKMLGKVDEVPNPGFWMSREAQELEGPAAIRILVCGNTGVGKSTLINRVFGISDTDDETSTSHRTRGTHDVNLEVVHPDRPDIIIHDSGGFEAGDKSQLEDVENFVRRKSSETDLKDRLHVIWFCMEMNTPRASQTATQNLFTSIAQFADEVPITVVATKKDEFIGIKKEEANRLFRKTIPDEFERFQKGKGYASEQVEKRMELIEEEMGQLGRFDGFIGVSEDDDASIKQLVETTIRNVTDEQIRLLFVAAQVADLDMKVDCAIVETMKVYKQILYTTGALAIFPITSTTNRAAAVITIIQKLMRCFGLPNVSAKVVFEIIKRNVWGTWGQNVSVAFGETIAALGMISTVVLGGAPIFLATGLVNASLVIPATTRMLLMLSIDVILVLTRAFKETALMCIGQPLIKDVEKAAIRCRQISTRAHKDVVALIPKRNPMRSLRYHKLQEEFRAVIQQYRVLVDQQELEALSRSSTLIQTSGDPEAEAEVEQLQQDLARVKLGVQEVETAHLMQESDLEERAHLVDIKETQKRGHN